MIKLTVTQGPDKGRTIQLEPGQTYTIGCEDEATLSLSDPMVLKGHCSVEIGPDFVILRNHTANAGTFVGDRKISQAKLKIPSRFRIGDSVIGLTPIAAAKKQAKPAAAGRDLTGKIIGGYKLDEIVGRGGMGTVYRATQLSLHRDVAVKVLSRDLAQDKAFTDLFINEARAAAQLIHPNVVQVYDAGKEGDISFFSMEFISQGSVEEILDRAEGGKLPWEEAILWVLEAAHGLGFAESKGIVHRDIKPDNLMINGDGRCRIADLGLAKRGEGGEDQGIIGTPHFIPPEQALGKEVDGRADIYSLGATFFRMITGKTLFTGKTAKEIVLKHINEPPPAASSLEKNVPDDLDLVLARMLAKNPDQRYENAAALISALEEVCANHGIKGAIIKKGVGKKVLIPLVLLIIVGAFVIYKLATREAEKYVDPELIAREEAAQKEREAAIRKQHEAAREARRSEAKSSLSELNTEFFRVKSDNPLESVYDDPVTAERLEKQWLEVKAKFEAFAKGEEYEEEAEELGLKTEANKQAEFIQTRLDKAKASVAHRREQIGAKVAAASKIDKEYRDKLEDLLLRRQYNEAADLCARAGTDRPGGEQDPFKEVVNWVYVYDDVEQKATDIADIMKVVRVARKYFVQEKEKVLNRAKRDWNRILTEQVKALTPDSSDDDIRAVLKELREVISEFAKPETTATHPDIKRILGEARRHSTRIDQEIADRNEQRLRDDRMLVQGKQRRLASLDPDAPLNPVMHCEFADAKAQWNDVKGQLQTERYRAFVEERIKMLGWCEYLFVRFHADLKLSLANKNRNERPFPILDVDLPLEDSEKVLSTSFSKPPEDPFKFATRKRRKGKNEFHFSQFPMDWIHNAVFFHEGQLRWREELPAIRFALGAFCFETMQYAAAQAHFEKLAGDKIHGKVAQMLAARAAKEEAARKEWVETICGGLQSTKSTQEVDAIKKLIATFPARHEGTIFYLECMSHKATLTRDFYDETLLPIGEWPAVPTE